MNAEGRSREPEAGEDSRKQKQVTVAAGESSERGPEARGGLSVLIWLGILVSKMSF